MGSHGQEAVLQSTCGRQHHTPLATDYIRRRILLGRRVGLEPSAGILRERVGATDSA